MAVAALTLRGRACWLRYLQIGLRLLTLASSVYIADTCAPSRLPTGTYSINAVAAWGDSAGDTVYVPADKTNEETSMIPASCAWGDIGISGSVQGRA